MNTPRDRQNVEAVLQVSVKANDELYREIKRDANMCDALRELMKDDLEDARKLGESEGEVRGEARGKVMGEVVGEAKIILKMNHSGMSPENIASITGIDLIQILACDGCTVFRRHSAVVHFKNNFCFSYNFSHCFTFRFSQFSGIFQIILHQFSQRITHIRIPPYFTI